MGHQLPAEPLSSLPPTLKMPIKPAHYAPRILFIGAGSQGHAYAEPIARLGLGHVVAVCDPIATKREQFGRRYIWGLAKSARAPSPCEEFEDWTDFIHYETTRRERIRAGEISAGDVEFLGVDAVFVCVLDELHVHVVKGLAPLGLHIMCEKPLATRLEHCIDMWGALRATEKKIFAIAHVLRYSPQNVLLRKLVRVDKIIGDVVSIEHTEPVGWWHMAHSFVR
jgi:predicted dehydrogenase